MLDPGSAEVLRSALAAAQAAWIAQTAPTADERELAAGAALTMMARESDKERLFLAICTLPGAMLSARGHDPVAMMAQWAIWTDAGGETPGSHEADQ